MPSESGEQGTVRYIRCGSCGAPNPGSEAVCGRCGKPLHGPAAGQPARPGGVQAVQQLPCPKCGKRVPVGSKFCGFCGAALSAVAQPAVKGSERPSTPAQPIPPKVPIPAPKPIEPLPRSAPSVTPVLTPSAPVSAVPGAPGARPAGRPTTSTEGTQLFTGVIAPKIEASVSEVKPDGSTGQSVRLTQETVIGRGPCELSYPNDTLLALRHASLVVREGKVFLNDLNSQNGTFLKQRQDTELAPGDVFLLGRELFRFTTQSLDEVPKASAQGTQVLMGAPKLQRGPVTAKLEHIQLTGDVIEEFKLEKSETTLGRTTGDLVFRNDPYMSGTHARVVAQPGRFILQDLKSRNGVYRRLRGGVELRDGDEFFLGEQLFRLSVKVI